MACYGEEWGYVTGMGEEVIIHKIQDNAFCVKVEFEMKETNGRM